MNEDKEQEALLSIFIEEATELLNTMSDTLQKWSLDFHNKTYFSALKRDLHTLKGGARMVNQPEFSALAHELETLSEALLQDVLPADKTLYDWFCKGQDRLADMIETLRHKAKVASAADLISQYDKLIKKEDIKEAKETPKHTETAQAEPVAVSDVIRVHAGVLETLSHLTMEHHIIRVNLGHQLNILKNELKESKKILKNFQVKNQSKIFSQLRSMAKKMTEVFQSVESLMVQQNKISTQVDSELTATRLEPFQTVLPRLSRIARQLALELNKKIDFTLADTEGVMDRNLLEHLIPPLEHLLRNAIDHGIEAPALRLQENKPEVGSIILKFLRKGNDILIEMADDGAGMDPNRIRAKAIKMGLLAKEAVVSDEAVIRYIFEPGFSTRDVITEVSGRGVGMDVINTIVKGLGGNILVQSRPPLGTTITLRLPFTTSLNRALLFTVGNETYGILLSNVKNIILMKADSLRAALNAKQKSVKLDNKNYHLTYLGAIFQKTALPELSSSDKNVPVLLIEALDYRMALIVDELKGGQEVFVQSLGPQFYEFARQTLKPLP